jgi:mannan endo-1,4-beta-mannosidase
VRFPDALTALPCGRVQQRKIVVPVNRREMIGGSMALLAGCAAPPLPGPSRPAFVRREGARLFVGTEPYRFAGTNMWYAAYLGADAPFGNRARLVRELDRLAELGIGNIRILGSSELSPLKNSIAPAFRTRSGDYNETLFRGLDFALAEMGKRNMRAVIYLTNFWEWSGGMMTYLYWTNGGRDLDMNDPAHPWPEFPDMVAGFYSSASAVRLYHDYVRALVGRTNSITGRPYSDDGAIMAWQLANEPRPGGSDAVGLRQMPAYFAWIVATARLIKSIDPNHLVSTGSEGTQGCLVREDCVVQAHGSPDVDYLTAHIWPQNWSWADPKDLAGTWPAVEMKTRAYIAQQVAIAERLGKPLVIEEFGFPRDGGSLDPGTPTTFKDRFYGLIYGAVLDSIRSGGPITGSNFWAWGGEGRARHPDHHFRPGDPSYVGDPPHEPQGWYSVFDTDQSTQALIRAHSAAIASAPRD